jgi:hypothetical protein
VLKVQLVQLGLLAHKVLKVQLDQQAQQALKEQ